MSLKGNALIRATPSRYCVSRDQVSLVITETIREAYVCPSTARNMRSRSGRVRNAGSVIRLNRPIGVVALLLGKGQWHDCGDDSYRKLTYLADGGHWRAGKPSRFSLGWGVTEGVGMG
jgi:hypothetical protein